MWMEAIQANECYVLSYSYRIDCTSFAVDGMVWHGMTWQWKRKVIASRLTLGIWHFYRKNEYTSSQR